MYKQTCSSIFVVDLYGMKIELDGVNETSENKK